MKNQCISNQNTISTQETQRATSFSSYKEDTIITKRGTTWYSDEDWNEKIICLKSINPQFNDKIIIEKVLHYIRNTKTSVEAYEIRLYELCKRKQAEVGNKPINCDTIEIIHPLMKLKKNIGLMSDIQSEKLNKSFKEELENNPDIVTEYNILRKTIKFCSDFIAKFTLFKIDNYNYRTSGRSMNIKPLDLMELNKSLLTTETIWLSFAIKHQPLKLIADEATIQYSLILQSALNKVLEYIYNLNQVDFKAYPIFPDRSNRWTWKKSTNRFPNNKEVNHLEFQKLKMPCTLFGLSRLSPQENRALTLKSLIKEVEVAYRTFEKALIQRCLKFQSPLAITE
ncbi:unnamed protein product [Blepharisma stoltei]|uniref:Uncharacterized protein n=1 Tax=Blepharisma stoltei TaxID=1481888 RepID=A0AAU9J9N1_9CILI|nr:unnamed protein product [Blepharisma stoltei]